MKINLKVFLIVAFRELRINMNKITLGIQRMRAIKLSVHQNVRKKGQEVDAV